MRTIKFPDDFVKRPHPLARGESYIHEKYKNAFQYCWPSFDEKVISVIGGSAVFCCDGSGNSFEMFDLREDEPKGYLTANQINNHLKKNPFN